MFKQYVRFLDDDKRNRTYIALETMSASMLRYIPIPKIDNRRLRYCPICVEEDKKMYGETYWHRKHQIIGANICCKHHCILQNSEVQMKKKDAKYLISANEAIRNMKVEVKSGIEEKLSNYLCELFDYDLQDGIDYKKFFDFKLYGTKYTSQRGVKKDTTLLFNDISKYYANYDESRIKELWHLVNLLARTRHDELGIAQIAMYLGISARELCEMKMERREDKVKEFDEKVIQNLRNGETIVATSKKYGISIQAVKGIRDGMMKRY